MFRGVQHINLDAKGRMAVPSRQRELLSVMSEGHIVLTVDTQARAWRFTPCLSGSELNRCAGVARIEACHQALSAVGAGVRK